MAVKTKFKIYVGVKLSGRNGRQIREVFKCEYEPTTETHGDRYIYVIGPFKTQRGAYYMARKGENNPLCQHVDDAERLAKLEDPKEVLW